MSEHSGNYYLVRTYRELIDKDIVGVGWVEHRFDECKDAEEAIKQIDEDYGIGRKANQIRRFFAITEGDIVIAPLPYSIAIGYATGGLIFDDSAYDIDGANQRKVRFLRNVDKKIIAFPRDSFSEAFQRRIRVMGIVVNNINEFADEIETAITEGDKGIDNIWQHRLNQVIEEHRETFKKKLISNIQKGVTNLKTGGLGLEDLVRGLLELDGYHASIFPKTRFGDSADADIEASRSDRFSTSNLLVQVKHHYGCSDDYGIKQLQQIRKDYYREFSEHSLVFVTSASVEDAIRKKAENSDVFVIDGEELAEWIFDHIDGLDKETKIKLGIYEVPSVL